MLAAGAVGTLEGLRVLPRGEVSARAQQPAHRGVRLAADTTHDRPVRKGLGGGRPTAAMVLPSSLTVLKAAAVALLAIAFMPEDWSTILSSLRTGGGRSLPFWLGQAVGLLLLSVMTWALNTMWDRYADATATRVVNWLVDTVIWLLTPPVRLACRLVFTRVAVLGQEGGGVRLGLAEVGLRVHGAHVLGHHHVVLHLAPPRLQVAHRGLHRLHLALAHRVERLLHREHVLAATAQHAEPSERIAPPPAPTGRDGGALRAGAHAPGRLDLTIFRPPAHAAAVVRRKAAHVRAEPSRWLIIGTQTYTGSSSSAPTAVRRRSPSPMATGQKTTP